MTPSLPPLNGGSDAAADRPRGDSGAPGSGKAKTGAATAAAKAAKATTGGATAAAKATRGGGLTERAVRGATNSRISPTGALQHRVQKAAQAKYDEDGEQTNKVSQKAAKAVQTGIDAAKDVATVSAAAASGNAAGAVKAAVTAKTTRRGMKAAAIAAVAMIAVATMVMLSIFGSSSSNSSSTSHTSNQASAHTVASQQLDQGQRTSGYDWQEISTAAELAGADPWVVAAVIMDSDQNGLSWNGEAGEIVKGTPETVTVNGGEPNSGPVVADQSAKPSPPSSESGSAAPSPEPSEPSPSGSKSAAPAPSESAAAGEAPVAPTREQIEAQMPASGVGGDVQVIGDSLSVGATDLLTEQLPGITVDGKVGRSYQEGLKILQAQDPASRRPITVLALGINSAAGANELNAALEAVGEEGKLVLVTPSGPRPWVRDLTAQMHQMAAANPTRVSVADWNATAEYVTDFSGDQIHVGPQGASVYARTVRLAVEAIAAKNPDGSVSPLPAGTDGPPTGSTIQRPDEVNFVGLDPEVEPVEPEDLTDRERALKLLAQQVAEKRGGLFPDTRAQADLGTGYSQTQNFDGRVPTPEAEAEQARQKTLEGWTEVIKHLPILEAEERAARIAQTAVDLHVGKRDLYPPVSMGLGVPGMTCQAADGTGGKIAIPEQYREALESASKVSGIPVEILAAQLEAESGWNPNAYNPISGASGIAQFMPRYWHAYSEGADIFDPQAGIRAQGKLMKENMDHPYVLAFAGDDPELRIRWALTAYNAGANRLPESGGDFSRMYRDQSRVYADKIFALAGGITVECDQNAGGEFTGELGTGKWVNPLPGSVITSPWGPRPCPFSNPAKCTDSVVNHDGLDMSTGGGTEVLAPTDMTITMLQRSEKWGWNIRGTQIGEPGLNFMFVHCQEGSFKVTMGQKVAAGQPLCIEGKSGMAEGEHLHFTVIHPGVPTSEETTLENTYNPYLILKEKGVL